VNLKLSIQCFVLFVGRANGVERDWADEDLICNGAASFPVTDEYQ
jgi:hypothetical protein